MRIEAIAVEKRFPGLEVLRGANLAVAAGEVVAIQGTSGTGKSTLLHCLGLLDRADRGSIRIDGEDVSALSSSARSDLRGRRIGFVFQAFHLLPEFTLRENILLAARCAGLSPAALGERAQELIDRLGLTGREEADVRVLSGGERQRVALCRALLLRPGVILADEPTGNLDPSTADLVLTSMLDVVHTEQASLIMVTHDPQVAARADRQLQLREGTLHNDGLLGLDTTASSEARP